jgi:hypothetical protein
MPGADVAQPDDPPLNNLAFTCIPGSVKDINGEDSTAS